METTATENKKFLEIFPKDSNIGRGKVLRKRRMLLGSSDACDLRFNAASIDAIHAVIEVGTNGGKIYDMNSRSGISVNGKKVIASDFNVGDVLNIGGFDFEIKIFNKSDILPPPLQMLQPDVIEDKPVIKKSKTISSSQKEPSKLPDVVPDVAEEFVPRVEYPLAKDPNAEFSEYIFEDVESLYPIFKYEPEKLAVEIIILFNGQIYSVDFLPAKDGIYKMVGSRPSGNEVEYAYLGQKEKLPFVSVKGEDIFVTPLPGYQVNSIEETAPGADGSIYLMDDDIVSFEHDRIKIFVRKTERPPQVKHAPVFRRDKEFKKYLFIVFAFVFLFLGALSLFEVDPELEKEKAPERIATILYKKPKKPAVTKKSPPKKTPDKPKTVAQKSPNKKKVEKKQVKKTAVKKQQQTNKVPKVGQTKQKKVGKVRKANPLKGPKNNIKKVSPPKKRISKTSQSSAKKGSTRKAAPTKAKGRVDTYKSFNFKSTISSLMAKGGGAATAKTSGYTADIGTSGISGSSESARSQLAKVSKNVGSLTGAASGKLDSATGTEGIADKKSIFTAGLPYKTVILGGMDPDTIRQILIDHIPQFRNCYQTALDRAKTSFDGVVKLNFVIGSSGYVTRAGIDTYKNIPPKVQRCVVNVLKGIKFPEPLGGGVVEVNQPFNFYPRAN